MKTNEPFDSAQTKNITGRFACETVVIQARDSEGKPVFCSARGSFVSDTLLLNGADRFPIPPCILPMPAGLYDVCIEMFPRPYISSFSLVAP